MWRKQTLATRIYVILCTVFEFSDFSDVTVQVLTGKAVILGPVYLVIHSWSVQNVETQVQVLHATLLHVVPLSGLT